ncbi:MAG: hypothetical protein AAF412_04130 [Pseudomonadota bacterium]
MGGEAVASDRETIERYIYRVKVNIPHFAIFLDETRVTGSHSAAIGNGRAGEEALNMPAHLEQMSVEDMRREYARYIDELNSERAEMTVAHTQMMRDVQVFKLSCVKWMLFALAVSAIHMLWHWA